MIKYVSSLVVLSTLLVGCGGSDNDDKKPPKSSAAISTSAPATSAAVSSSVPLSSIAPSSVAPSSVAPSSVAPSSVAPSSVAPSSVAVSSSVGPVVIEAAMTTAAWRGNNGGTVTADNIGVTLVATADGQGAVFDVLAPTKLEGATIEMRVNVSNEYQASGADLQVFAQIKDNATYPGEYNCYTPNSQLTPGSDQVIECLIEETDKKFDQTTFDVQVGIQGKIANGAIAGTVVIKNAKITLTAAPASSSSSSTATSSTSSSTSSAPSNVITLNLTQNWMNNGGTVSYTTEGVVYAPAAPAQYDANVYTEVPGPKNFEGATLTMVIVPDAAFKASGQNPQPLVQLGGGNYAGEYGCWFNNSDLVVGADNVLTCLVNEGTTFNVTGTMPVRFGLQAVQGTSYGGTILIKSAIITLAQ